ncbi:hypothetical protein [Hymenobacter sp. 102]|uniref:hypothetical protein n=1 Tax=Hymenobacter sp. 102 TaxID=3403152 RepID=UPI003CFB4586
MQEVYQGRRVIWQSKANQLLTIGVCFLFVAVSIWLGAGYNSFAFWLGMLLLGGSAVVILYRMFSPDILLVDPNSEQGRAIRKELDNALLEQISVYEDGLLVRENPDLPARHFAWRNLTAAFGYKIDLYSSDEICLDLFWADAPRLILSESMPQWLAVLAELQKQVPTVPPGWYADISVPAFETKLTLLFEKDGLSLPEAEQLYYGSKG